MTTKTNSIFLFWKTVICDDSINRAFLGFGLSPEAAYNKAEKRHKRYMSDI